MDCVLVFWLSDWSNLILPNSHTIVLVILTPLGFPAKSPLGPVLARAIFRQLQEPVFVEEVIKKDALVLQLLQGNPEQFSHIQLMSEGVVLFDTLVDSFNGLIVPWTPGIIPIIIPLQYMILIITNMEIFLQSRRCC